MLIQRFGHVVVVDQRVNFLGGHADVFLHHDHAGGRFQAVGDQDGVDGVIAGQIPAVLDAVGTAGKVRQGAMQGFMGKHELCFIGTQFLHVFGVVVKLAGIRTRGWTPCRIRYL